MEEEKARKRKSWRRIILVIIIIIECILIITVFGICIYEDKMTSERIKSNINNINLYIHS